MATLHNRLAKVEIEIKKYSDREKTMIEQASAAIIHLVDFKEMMSEVKTKLDEMQKSVDCKINLIADSLTLMSKKIC